MKSRNMMLLESKLRKMVREQISKLREEDSDSESTAWDLLDAVEGDLDDTPSIDAFFRRKGITDKSEKQAILTKAGKLKSKEY